jgi:hypothetical protein
MTKPFHLNIVVLILLVFVASCTLPHISRSSPVDRSTASSSAPTITIDTENTTSSLEPTETIAGIDSDQSNTVLLETNHMNIQIGDKMLTATLVENSSVSALKEILAKRPITINMRDYGSMEKVGPLGIDLPRNDQQITTEAGDIILYQGNALAIYYAPNSWNFTRIGKIDNVNSEMMKEILGDRNVTLTISLPD